MRKAGNDWSFYLHFMYSLSIKLWVCQVRWKKQWTVPHRLLQKRSLISPRQHNQCSEDDAVDMLDCHHEWLVKWHGLDYKHATWELENSSLFNSPEGQGLIFEYENRRKKAKMACSSTADKVLLDEIIYVSVYPSLFLFWVSYNFVDIDTCPLPLKMIWFGGYVKKTIVLSVFIFPM